MHNTRVGQAHLPEVFILHRDEELQQLCALRQAQLCSNQREGLCGGLSYWGGHLVTHVVRKAIQHQKAQQQRERVLQPAAVLLRRGLHSRAIWRADRHAPAATRSVPACEQSAMVSGTHAHEHVRWTN